MMVVMELVMNYNDDDDGDDADEIYNDNDENSKDSQLLPAAAVRQRSSWLWNRVQTYFKNLPVETLVDSEDGHSLIFTHDHIRFRHRKLHTMIQVHCRHRA